MTWATWPTVITVGDDDALVTAAGAAVPPPEVTARGIASIWAGVIVELPAIESTIGVSVELPAGRRLETVKPPTAVAIALPIWVAVMPYSAAAARLISTDSSGTALDASLRTSTTP